MLWFYNSLLHSFKKSFNVFYNLLSFIENFRWASMLIFQMVLSGSTMLLLGRLLLDQYEAIHDLEKSISYLLLDYNFKKNKMVEIVLYL